MCLQPVTQKTGLQCEGACLSWVHYSCLNYTPGRIKDIRAGVIKVTCPCPDCNTQFPKEYRTDEPFRCSNEQCPANRPPKCENLACPSNIEPPSYNIPFKECGASCKKHGVTQTKLQLPPTSNKSSSSGFCDSACPSSGDVPGNMQSGGGGGGGAAFPCMQAVEQMCNTVGQLTTQINDLMCKVKQAMHQQMGPEEGGGCCPKNKTSCSQKGPKSKCPAPCYCPGNPKGKK